MLLRDFLEVCCDDFVIYNLNADNEFLCSSLYFELPEGFDYLLDCCVKHVCSDFYIFNPTKGYIKCLGIYLLV